MKYQVEIVRVEYKRAVLTVDAASADEAKADAEASVSDSDYALVNADETLTATPLETWSDTGEGPWQNPEDAEAFAQAEVGLPYRIEERPEGWRVFVKE